MEEICNALSDKLGEAGTGVYTVFYEDELLDVLPETSRNRDVLEAALKKLNNGGYIEVRYARGSAFCLSFLRPYVMEKTTEEIEEVSGELIKDCAPCETSLTKSAYVLIGLCSFFGGLLGGVAVLLGAVI